MEIIKNKSFKNQDVVLDDYRYERCEFESCNFVFSATGTFVLKDNHISGNCRFTFTGQAANTVDAMKSIYAIGGWAKSMILKTFEEIAPDAKDLH